MTEEEPSICEQENYNKLFRDLYAPVTKYVYYKCGNLQQAEDIVQSVFIKLWELCATISFYKAKSYVYTSVNNSFLNSVQHNKVVLKYRQGLSERIEYENPEYLIEVSEFRAKLIKAINELPEKEREVFLLSRVEKKTYSEIAEMTELTVKAIERRMSKALLILRNVLGKEIKI